MEELITVELIRDCEAVQIPHGTTVTIPQGTAVDVAQTLGGSFTVHAPGGLFRISNRDADALGFEPAGSAQAEKDPAARPRGTIAVEESQVWDVLKTCFDPEIPVNIVDLGLIYDLSLQAQKDGRSKVEVKMTLTAPGCGMGGVIARDAQEKLLMLDGMEEATVEIVWDPPWNQSMITPEGRRALGLE